MVDFYPSVSENLLGQALSWASSLADISHEDISIIKHARKSLLFEKKKRTSQILPTIWLKNYSGIKFKNFLDVTFDLSTGKYKPYRKPNDDPLYINKHSNHPPSILRQLPTSINKRISTLSSDKQTFEDAAPAYQSALGHSNSAIS